MGPLMYFGMKEEGIEWYLLNEVGILLVLIFAYVSQKSKRGFFISTVVTSMTMSDEKKWKQVNKMRALIAYVIFVPLLIANTVLFIIDKQNLYAYTITDLIIIGVLLYFIILTIYTDILERRWLAEQKKKGHSVSEFKGLFSNISKKRLYIGILILVITLIALNLLIRILTR